MAGARRLAEKLERDVEVVAKTEGVRIDAERTASLWSALSHAVRNAVDHGIEPRDARAAAGKPTLAHIEVAVTRQPGSWPVTIAAIPRWLTVMVPEISHSRPIPVIPT